MKNKKVIILILFLILTGCKEKTYTVTFDTTGGSNIEKIILEKGHTIENIEDPTKEGYLFVSWLKNGIEYNKETPVTEDITLTANWIEEPTILNTYTVSFVVDDKVEKTVVKENEVINEPKVPEKENYIFLGWYIGNEKYDFKSKVTKDIILTAKYELNLVTVTYDLDGGIGLALETIQKNSTISIPETPTKKGYRFLKWTLNNKDFSFTTKITKDITLTAVWEKIEYVTITFDTDGGSLIESKTIEKYSKIDELPTPVKEGYTFKEWQLDNQIFNTDTEIQNNITIKAIYENIE